MKAYILLQIFYTVMSTVLIDWDLQIVHSIPIPLPRKSRRIRNLPSPKYTPERHEDKVVTDQPNSKLQILEELENLLNSVEGKSDQDIGDEPPFANNSTHLEEENDMFKMENVNQESMFHGLMPAYPCDEWEDENKVCWLDRNVGNTVTFVLSLPPSEFGHGQFLVKWTQVFITLHTNHKKYFVINPSNPPWNIVIGSGGSELRLSPITEVDVDFNYFTATVQMRQKRPLRSIHFKVRTMPVDQGVVYPGAFIMLNMPTFISLPSESMAFRWYLEKGPKGILPSNMQASPSGAVLTISELRKDQEGVISCAVYTNLGVHATQKRFLIKEVDIDNNKLIFMATRPPHHHYDVLLRRKREANSFDLTYHVHKPKKLDDDLDTSHFIKPNESWNYTSENISKNIQVSKRDSSFSSGNGSTGLKFQKVEPNRNEALMKNRYGQNNFGNKRLNKRSYEVEDINYRSPPSRQHSIKTDAGLYYQTDSDFEPLKSSYSYSFRSPEVKHHSKRYNSVRSQAEGGDPNQINSFNSNYYSPEVENPSLQTTSDLLYQEIEGNPLQKNAVNSFESVMPDKYSHHINPDQSELKYSNSDHIKNADFIDNYQKTENPSFKTDFGVDYLPERQYAVKGQIDYRSKIPDKQNFDKETQALQQEGKPSPEHNALETEDPLNQSNFGPNNNLEKQVVQQYRIDSNYRRPNSESSEEVPGQNKKEPESSWQDISEIRNVPSDTRELGILSNVDSHLQTEMPFKFQDNDFKLPESTNQNSFQGDRDFLQKPNYMSIQGNHDYPQQPDNNFIQDNEGFPQKLGNSYIQNNQVILQQPEQEITTWNGIDYRQHSEISDERGYSIMSQEGDSTNKNIHPMSNVQFPENNESGLVAVETEPPNQYVQIHERDLMSILIAECDRDTQCSLNAVCIEYGPENKGFCRCLPWFEGNGVFCWENYKFRT